MTYCWYQPSCYELVVASNSPPALNDVLLVLAFLHKIDIASYPRCRYASSRYRMLKRDPCYAIQILRVILSDGGETLHLLLVLRLVSNVYL